MTYRERKKFVDNKVYIDNVAFGLIGSNKAKNIGGWNHVSSINPLIRKNKINREGKKLNFVLVIKGCIM